jgi:hypothetical protein
MGLLSGITMFRTSVVPANSGHGLRFTGSAVRAQHREKANTVNEFSLSDTVPAIREKALNDSLY